MMRVPKDTIAVWRRMEDHPTRGIQFKEMLDALEAEQAYADHLQLSLDLYVGFHEEARDILAAVADRMDSFAYDELSALLSDGVSDHYGEEYRSRLARWKRLCGVVWASRRVWMDEANETVDVYHLSEQELGEARAWAEWFAAQRDHLNSVIQTLVQGFERVKYRADNADSVLHQVREYIEAHEHPDDWNVPCVYTKDVRVMLGMPPTRGRDMGFINDDE